MKRTLVLTLVFGGATAMAGCVSAPTYGTGKRSDVQLLEDVSNIVSLSPGQREKVAYNPRPTLVKPADTGILPPPQKDVSEDNPAWPESPEEIRARIRAEADANADNPNFKPRVIPGGVSVQRPGTGTAGSTPKPKQTKNPLRMLSSKEAKREQINERIASQPDAPSRRYLSDPPVDYQEAAATAPVNDIGESELDKQKRIKRLIKKGDKKGWRDYLPF